MEIVELSKDEYKGYEIIFEYTTNYYYDVIYTKINNEYKIEFINKEFEKEISKSFISKLFEDYLDKPICYAAIDNDKIIGIIEMNYEEWNKRIRITNIHINKDYRNLGIGRSLMDKAKVIALEKGARQIVLETQSCNEKAIKFYHKYGFTLIGFDLCCYSNNDIDKKEVRVELGYNIGEVM